MKTRDVASLILLFTLLYIHWLVHPIMYIKQMLLELAAATNLHVAYRTHVLWFLTAFLAFVSCQRRFPRVLFATCVARISATVPSVIILGPMGLDVIWKEKILSVRAFNRGLKQLSSLHSFFNSSLGRWSSLACFYFLKKIILFYVCQNKFHWNKLYCFKSIESCLKVSCKDKLKIKI